MEEKLMLIGKKGTVHSQNMVDTRFLLFRYFWRLKENKWAELVLPFIAQHNEPKDLHMPGFSLEL